MGSAVAVPSTDGNLSSAEQFNSFPLEHRQFLQRLAAYAGELNTRLAESRGPRDVAAVRASQSLTLLRIQAGQGTDASLALENEVVNAVFEAEIFQMMSEEERLRWLGL